jgi:hypothetical protein
MKSICVVAILLSLTTGAAAGEYYIVQDTSTRQCSVVEIPPTTTQFVLLEKGKVFSDRDEAKAARHALRGQHLRGRRERMRREERPR